MQFEYSDEKICTNSNGNKSSKENQLSLQIPYPFSTPSLDPHLINSINQPTATPQQQFSLDPRNSYSDPLLSPNLLLTPNLNNLSNNDENYIHYHQSQNSISSLNSFINSGNHHKNGSVSNATTISDGYFVNSNNEPLTPPDYFSQNITNLDSLSRKNSTTGSIWNSNQIQNFNFYSPWSANNLLNLNNNNNSNNIIGSNNVGPATSDALTNLIQEQVIINPQHVKHHSSSSSIASLDEIQQQQKLNRKRLLSLQSQTNNNTTLNSNGGLNMSSFEKQFQQMNVSSETNPPNTFNQRRSLAFPLSSVTVLDETSDILGLSKDQYGCRFLQKKIDDDFNANFPLIFQYIYKHSNELMVDPFGNYLIQKIMVCSNNEEIDLILINISSSIFNICKNQHGTRACQKLIDCLTTFNHHKLLQDCISPFIVDLIEDLNGNHVIQKCIHKFQNENLQFIIDSICLNMIKISTHKHGCCVLQKLLNKSNNLQIYKLGEEIVKNSIILMQDQFGNYVVQYLISLNLIQLNEKLINFIIPFIYELSIQKFSSNVIEKCLKIKFPDDFRNPLFDALLNVNILTSLIKDQYGNYVIQTAMDLSTLDYKYKFAVAIKPLLPLVKFTSFGKRIQNKVISISNELEKSNYSFPDAQQQGLLPPIELNTFDYPNSKNGDVERYL